ncbi:Helz2 [Symbiodinium sp. CCMP2592]|nr:Helz2 [Symbiodinium sp. CCMP2592]
MEQLVATRVREVLGIFREGLYESQLKRLYCISYGEALDVRSLGYSSLTDWIFKKSSWLKRSEGILCLLKLPDLVCSKQELLRKHRGTFRFCCGKCSKCYGVGRAGPGCVCRHGASGAWLLVYEPPAEESAEVTVIRKPGEKVSGCVHFFSGNSCRQQCPYAHSEIELDVWNVLRSGTASEELVLEPQFLFADQPAFRCLSCADSFATEQEFRQHLQSQQHVDCLDMELQHMYDWKKRPPPRRHFLGLCIRFQSYHRCQAGSACSQPHSESELSEWRQRHELLERRKKLSSDNGLQPWRRDLAFKWLSATGTGHLASFGPQSSRQALSALDALRGLLLEDNPASDGLLLCAAPCSVSLPESPAKHVWHCKVVAGRHLLRACLLDPAKSSCFWLQLEKDPVKYQELQIAHQQVSELSLNFAVGRFGRFEQWLILDFGGPPFVMKRFSVTVENYCHGSLLSEATLTESLSQEPKRWTWWTSVQGREEPSRLMLKHKPPEASLDSIYCQDNGRLDWNDLKEYRMNLHCFLKKEEEADTARLHTLSGDYDLEVLPEDATGATAVIDLGQSGKLREGGQLLLDGRCNKAWLASSASSSAVFEVRLKVQEEETLAVKLWLQPHVLRCLCRHPSARVHVQFQFDRREISSQHEVVDVISQREIVHRLVLPNLERYPSPTQSELDATQESVARELTDSRLPPPNPAQLRVMSFALCGLQRSLPPLLVYGPWGTGKTLTLAHAAICVTRRSQRARILICTHTNSAADLFVERYLGNADSDLGTTVLRLCARSRSGRISDAVMQCSASLDDLSIQQLLDAQIVICTLSLANAIAKRITGLLEEHFTHIFVDEGGQAKEPETLQAVACAGPRTCLIIAGDHKQMRCQSSSNFAQEAGPDLQSLLQRMFLLYGRKEAKTLRVLLNVTAHTLSSSPSSEGTSTVRNGQRSTLGHEHRCPGLAVHVEAKAELTYEPHGCGNIAEVRKVLEVAQEVSESLRTADVGVISTELLQVWRLRELRGRTRVDVQRISNVQGQEFDVVIVCTVASHRMDASLQSSFGFLSDEAMLNVALTRARRCVIVVGDAKALCSAGCCASLWRRFIEAAQNEAQKLGGSSFDVASIESQAREFEEDIFEDEDENLPDDEILLLTMRQGVERNMGNLVRPEERRRQIDLQMEALRGADAAAAPRAPWHPWRARPGATGAANSGRANVTITPSIQGFARSSHSRTECPPAIWDMWPSEDHMLRIVLIAEKPAMARAWARALHDEPEFVKPHGFVTGVYHFERDYNGSLARWCVSSTIGHFTETRMNGGLARMSNGAASPEMFTRELVDDCFRPVQKKMREQLRQLSRNSDMLVLALDADMEGEFIARQVARVFQPLMRSSAVWRCWFTALGKRHLLKALSKLTPLDEAVADACEVRRQVDYRGGQACTLTLSAFADRHQEHLAGALPKFSALRQERRASKQGEEDFEPSLSYGPVQTPTIFLALYHFVVESSKQTSQGTWRVKVSLYSESTGEFDCYSEPLRSEEDARKQKEAIEMAMAFQQRPPEQPQPPGGGLEDPEASESESGGSLAPPARSGSPSPSAAEKGKAPVAPKSAKQEEAAVAKAREEKKSRAVTVRQITEELVPGFERPKPLNFVGLMKLAAAYGYDPPYTERLAQNLYEMGFISYPRTESSQYSEDEEAQLEDTVRDLARAPLPMLRGDGLNVDGEIQEYAKRLLNDDKLQRPRKGVATGDHEPITPSLQSDHLLTRFSSTWQRLQHRDNAEERKDTMTLYDLILRYFLASLSPDCVMQARTVTLAFVDVEIPFGGQFRVQHRTQLEQGWLEILPVDTAPLLLDGDVPYLSKEALLTATSVQLKHEPPEPSRPLTVARLLHMMEVHGIGTDASIPKHFEKLVQRGYFQVYKKKVDRVCMSEATWAWHVLQDDEFHAEMFGNPESADRRLLTISVMNVGKALVAWLWHHEPHLVQPTVRAEIEEETRAVAFSGRSASDVNRKLTSQFRDWSASLSSKLEERHADFTGHELLRLLQPRRNDGKTAMLNAAFAEIAAVDLRAMEVKRAAALHQHSPTSQPVDEARTAYTAPAAMDLQHCLLPDTMVLVRNNEPVPASSIQAGAVLLTMQHADVSRCRTMQLRERDLVTLTYMVEGSTAVKSVIMTTDHFIPVLRSGARAGRPLPARDVRVGDRLFTRTARFAIVQERKEEVRPTQVVQIEFEAPATMLVAGPEEDLQPNDFVEVHGCGEGVPSLDTSVKILHFNRFDNFADALLESEELQLCVDDLRQNGFSAEIRLDDDPPRGLMFVSSNLAPGVMWALRQRKQEARPLWVSSVVVCRRYELIVRDCARHFRAPGRRTIFVKQEESLDEWMNEWQRSQLEVSQRSTFIHAAVPADSQSVTAQSDYVTDGAWQRPSAWRNRFR